MEQRKLGIHMQKIKLEDLRKVKIHCTLYMIENGQIIKQIRFQYCLYWYTSLLLQKYLSKKMIEIITFYLYLRNRFIHKYISDHCLSGHMILLKYPYEP